MESLDYNLDAAPRGVECTGHALKVKLLSQLPGIPELHHVPDAAFDKPAFWHETIGQYAAYERLPPWGEPALPRHAPRRWYQPPSGPRRLAATGLSGASLSCQVRARGPRVRGPVPPPASGRPKTPEELAFFFFQRYLLAEPDGAEDYEGEEMEEGEVDDWEEGEGASPMSDDAQPAAAAPGPPGLAAPRAQTLSSCRW